jgi:glycosyltransferase involved in cell wall biosynthesis
MAHTINDDTYLIIPVYNEASVIRNVIEAASKTFPNIVCVDDGSTDSSAKEITHTKAHLVQHSINLGQGAALQTGFEFALRDPHAKYFVTFDADGQHRISDVINMLDEIRKGEYDVILGSRFLGTEVQASRLRRFILKLATSFSNTTSGTHLTDAHNGLRVFSLRFTENLEITMPDMTHASELVMIIGRSGLKYKEMPVTIDYTDYSRAKGQSLWNSINILFDLFFQYILRGKK